MTDATSAHAIAIPSGLAASYVNMTEAEAVELARQRFGIDGRPTRFATEKDDTFRIAPPVGPRYILKIANPTEDVAEIDLQIRALDHIAARAHDLPVPQVIPNDAGERHFLYLDHAGQQRQVRMMSYLEGQPLSDVPANAHGRVQIGKLLARLRLALADFSHPSDGRTVPWDVKNLPSLDGLLAEIKEPAQRRKIEMALARFGAIDAQLKQCRTQVLHNDFTQSNIVVDSSLPQFVSGVIDFGDIVRTAIAIDVSTAVLNQLPLETSGDFFADARDMLRGYLSLTDLTPHELGLIPHLVLSRLATRVLLSTAMANRVPSVAAYVLRNTEKSWPQIDWFLERSMDDISDRLMSLSR